MFSGLSRVNWHDFYLIEDPETAWAFLLENYYNILDEIAPIKTLSNVKNKKEWVTKELLQKIHFRDYLKTCYNKSKSNSDWTRFKKARNIVNNSVRLCKKQYIQKVLKENVKNPKKYWEILHDLTGRTKKKGVKIDISSDATGILNDNEQANLLNEHFASIGVSLTNSASERADEQYYEQLTKLLKLLDDFNLLEPFNVDFTTIKTIYDLFGLNGSIFLNKLKKF